MTRVPPSSVAFFEEDVEARIDPSAKHELTRFLTLAGAPEDALPEIIEGLSSLPRAVREYEMVDAASAEAGPAREFRAALTAALQKVDTLLADPIARSVLRLAMGPKLQNYGVIEDLRRIVPHAYGVMVSTDWQLPDPARGGAKDRNDRLRRFLAGRLVETFDRKNLDNRTTQSSPMTRVFALLLRVTKLDEDGSRPGRPDITLRKAVKFLAQQRSKQGL